MQYLVLGRSQLDDVPVKLCPTKEEALIFARSAPSKETRGACRVMGHRKGPEILFYSIVAFDDDGRPTGCSGV